MALWKMRRGALWLLGCGMAWPMADAAACGQSTHVWTALHAREHLADGPLKQWLMTEVGETALINGTMFPDGGYSPLSDDDYGEMAHWEPFQDRVMDWAWGQAGSPYEGEAGWAVAFWLGLGAHGMGDQVFDGAYLYRSKAKEPASWDLYDGADTGTDIVYVASVGPAPLVEDADLPYDALVGLYAEAGHEVSASTLRTGQASLRFAIDVVSGAARRPETVAGHEENFPWASGHLEDEAVPGAPVCLGELIAEYWTAMLGRAEGSYAFEAAPVVASFPEEGAMGWTRAAEDVDSLISVVLSRAISQDSLVDGGVVLRDSAGRNIPVDAWMFYREHSNVLNVRPLEDLSEDQVHTLTVQPGLQTMDGVELQVPWTLSFSTAQPEVVEAPERGCQTAPGPWHGMGLVVGLAAWRRRRRYSSAM